MKFLVSWIASYLPGPVPEVAELRAKLTSAGLIVEGVEGEGPDAVLDIELTANRPDGMNHRGVAREAAAVLARPFEDGETSLIVRESTEDVAGLALVRIEDPAACTRFSARVVSGIAVRPAPADMQARFARLGLGPISAPVDATNHVLWDIGQPMHAYDLDTLAKGEDGKPLLVARRAKAGEKLVTLDGVERTLTPDHLVIADAEKPVGLAGVMGGLHTAISASTKNILLEAARFDPAVVRRGAKSLGMHTDASHRFERGTDPRATVDGLDRAARLIVASCGGRVAKGVIDVVGREFHRKRVSLREARLDQFLGMKVPFEEAREILHSLGFICHEAGRGILEVIVPSWRVDIEAEIDLIEEVIRLVGYDALPQTLPPSFNPTRVVETFEREEKARDVLAGAGLLETYSYSFVSAEENAPFVPAAPGRPVTLSNALGEPFTTMRASCAIGLLRAGRHNVRRGVSDLALFEVGRAYGIRDGVSLESRRVAVLFHGARRRHWSEPPREADFFDGSGAVASLFAGLGAAPPRFVAAEIPFLSAGRAAKVVTADGDSAGWAGVLAPEIAAAWDLTDPVLAEVDLLAIRPLPRAASIEAPSKLPGSEIDLTVLHRIALPWEELSRAVREGAPKELQALDVKYRWQGAGVPEGFVKTTLNLRFGSAERSLSREEVNGWRDAAVRRLLALSETSVDGVPGGSN